MRHLDLSTITSREPSSTDATDIEQADGDKRRASAPTPITKWSDRRDWSTRRPTTTESESSRPNSNIRARNEGQVPAPRRPDGEALPVHPSTGPERVLDGHDGLRAVVKAGLSLSATILTLLTHPTATHAMALALGYTAGSAAEGSRIRSVVSTWLGYNQSQTNRTLLY